MMLQSPLSHHTPARAAQGYLIPPEGCLTWGAQHTSWPFCAVLVGSLFSGKRDVQTTHARDMNRLAVSQAI